MGWDVYGVLEEAVGNESSLSSSEVLTPEDIYGYSPIHVDPTTQGVHTGSGVANVLLLNLALCIGTWPFWHFWLRKLPIYHTSGGSPDVWMWKVLKSDGFVAWCKNVGNAQPFEQITRCYGTDTAVYLAFLKVMCLGAFMLFLMSLIITPVHLACAEKEAVTEVVITPNRTIEYIQDELFTQHTVASVQEDPGLLYLHALAIIAATVTTLYLISVFRAIARKIFGANNPAETALARRTIKLAHFPTHGVTEKDLKDFYSTLYPGEVEAAYIAYDVRSRIDMNDRLRRVQLRLKCEMCKPREKQNETTNARLDARKEAVLGQIEGWHENLPTASAGFAHVVFKSVQTKYLALRRKHVVLPMTNTRLEHRSAHHPRDINWEDVGKVGSKFRRAVISLGLIAGLVFWSTPTAIFTTLQQATERIPFIQDLFGSLSPDEEDHSDKSDTSIIVTEYFPVVMYLILALCLPLIIEWASSKEPLHSRFQKRKLVMQRLYVYQLLCTFILPSVALSTIMAVVTSFNGTSHADRVVKRSMHHLFLPNSGAFFFNVLSVYATLGNWWELWRPAELCKYLNSVVRQKIDLNDGWAMWVLEFEFHWHYPLVLTAWAVAFNYTVYIPLVAPAFLIMCLAKLKVHAHHTRSNMIFRRNALDAAQYGKMVKTIVCLWLASMVICLTFSLGFFFFRSHRKKFYPHISILGFLWLYVVYTLFTTARLRKSEFVHDLPPASQESFVLLRADQSVSDFPGTTPVDVIDIDGAENVESDGENDSSASSCDTLDYNYAAPALDGCDDDELNLFTQPSAIFLRLEIPGRERGFSRRPGLEAPLIPHAAAPREARYGGAAEAPRAPSSSSGGSSARPRGESATRRVQERRRSPPYRKSRATSPQREPKEEKAAPKKSAQAVGELGSSTRNTSGNSDNTDMQFSVNLPERKEETGPEVDHKVDHTLYAAPFLHIIRDYTPHEPRRVEAAAAPPATPNSSRHHRCLPGQASFLEHAVYVSMHDEDEELCERQGTAPPPLPAGSDMSEGSVLLHM
eukprot:TRINITY_DN6711_c1_g4_i1.p1 TRINITY_DN6711_c1_g4~~TRINITY_DN6711_c1_g4_i1.p1  ORF type:complete len:1029 (+),score=331.52 TRINITY_DN6711_c1_g4_i1:85-3171(+)